MLSLFEAYLFSSFFRAGIHSAVVLDGLHLRRVAAPLLLIGLIAAASAAERPNIVFFLTDDQSFDSLGCYGNRDVETPNIDRLAKGGIAFDRHYDTTAICMASRANIVTGMFEYKTGCNFEHGPLIASNWKKSYPPLLRKSGYMTAMAGKIGFEVVEQPGGRSRLPKDDFDRWGAGPGQTHYETAKNPSMAKYAREYPHSTLAYGAFGRDFVREASELKKPFCLSISFKAPHRPVSPDPKFNEVYAKKSFRKPANYGREHGAHLAEQSRKGRQYERFSSWGYADRYDEVMRQYHQQIYAVDVAVGMVRDALEEHGVAGNTVIVFTSDNGFFCGSHGYGSKVLPYEEGSRVPLIYFDPRAGNQSRDVRCDALTGNVDLAPTFLELAGISVPPEMDGKSLLHLVKHPGSAHHDMLPLINVWGPSAVHSFGVVTREWKYVYWPYGGGGMKPSEELFDLRNDPHELSLSRDTAALAGMRQHYRRALSAWKADALPFHDYRRFATIFDPSVSWEDKAALKKK